MEEVAHAISIHDWGEALVRLVHLARNGALDDWENERPAAQPGGRVADFVAAIRSNQLIDASVVAAAPLAVLRALDQLLTTERRARRFTAVPYVVGDSSYWLVPRGHRFMNTPSLHGQAGVVESHLVMHRVVPTRIGTIDVEAHVPSGTLAHRLDTLASQRSPTLRVWVGHFADGCAVTWDAASHPAGRLRALGFDNPDRRRDALDATLTAAAASQADLLVLPELSLDLPLRRRVREWLARSGPDGQPMLVVPGSFHEDLDGRCFNTAPLLDGCVAEPLFTHRKLRVFGRVADDDIALDRAEAIHVGSVLHLLVTAIGTFTVLVCKDFIDAHHSVATLLQHAPVDWVLVPSYGDAKTSALQRERAALAGKVSVGCQAAVATIRDVGLSQGEHLPGFAYCLHRRTVIDVPPDGGLVELRLGEPIEPTRSAARKHGLRRVK